MKVSVIFTTYNQPEWLRKTLLGFAAQSFRGFELIVADDGSGPETKAVIDQVSAQYFANGSGPQLQHIWHKDEGFQKTVILNKALVASRGEYLIFTDGDCIPAPDFISTHLQHRSSGIFLSGGAVRLPLGLSQQITDTDIHSGDCFDYAWLRKNGMPWSLHNLKAINLNGLKSLFTALSRAPKTWNGNNSSCWRKDAMMVAGFDERMQYGGEDCEFGDRLENCGIKPHSVRYFAKTLHLDHGRPYVNKEALTKNAAIRKETQDKKLKKTAFGIDAGGSGGA
jgi:glycosyltransferase involved in cell wall biosynthesis